MVVILGFLLYVLAYCRCIGNVIMRLDFNPDKISGTDFL